MPRDNARDLKAFAIIGLVGLVLFLGLATYLGFFVLVHLRTTPNAPQQPAQPSIYDEPLGELGSHCGGSQHLPCRPGLSCSNDPSMPDSMGVCSRGSATGTVEFTGQPGDACTSGTTCSPGLFCKGLASSAGSCATIADDSPHILSLELGGTQPLAGWYRAKPGTKVTVTVQATNADSATAKLENLPGTKTADAGLTAFQQSPGGNYSATFIMPDNFSASLQVTVTAKNGDESSVAVKVGTVE
ncbi:MAG: hypothetical protein WA001_05040 [Patescibacteria group bacterium]